MVVCKSPRRPLLLFAGVLSFFVFLFFFKLTGEDFFQAFVHFLQLFGVGCAYECVQTGVKLVFGYVCVIVGGWKSRG